MNRARGRASGVGAQASCPVRTRARRLPRVESPSAPQARMFWMTALFMSCMAASIWLMSWFISEISFMRS